MKSTAQKRREARERIERKLIEYSTQLSLIGATVGGTGVPETEAERELRAHVDWLKHKCAYMADEIARIKAREADPKARRNRVRS